MRLIQNKERIPMEQFLSTQVTLHGYQAVFKPSKFGYSMAGLVNQEVIDELEVDRKHKLKEAEIMLNNVKRSVLKPEPWEEVTDGIYRIKFTWDEEHKPFAFDCDLNQLTDPDIPMHEGAQTIVKFKQKSYVYQDRSTYGTTLKLVGFQVLRLTAVDEIGQSVDEVRKLFKKREGFNSLKK